MKNIDMARDVIGIFSLLLIIFSAEVAFVAHAWGSPVKPWVLLAVMWTCVSVVVLSGYQWKKK
ncbi:MAG: hypothetical protein P8Y66_08115 [Nitrospirota bacterium]|jgi:uncharacterized membrane protein YbhN (UPF0104 family)